MDARGEGHGWESFWAAAGCEASPLLLLSLSLVLGVRGGVGASLRCCGMLLLIGGLGKDIRLHNRNRFRFGSQ